MHNKSVLKKLFIIAIIFCMSLSARADIRLPKIAGDGMVLQQQQSVNFWGWADPGEKISIDASWGQNASTATDDTGKWITKIDTPKAGGPYTVKINGKNSIELKNVLIGEVWICSGQSNMEFHMSWLNSDRIRADVQKSSNPGLKLFTVTKAISKTPEYDVEGQWLDCKPETANEFSATALYFGQKLQKELGIPVGLISTNWGGTVSEAWTSRETLAKYPEFKFALKYLENPEKAINDFKTTIDKYTSKWYEQVEEIDPGTQMQWYAEGYNSSSWKTFDAPNLWKDMELSGVDGSVWFRKEFTLDSKWNGKAATLRLAMVDDLDTTWINGKLIGTTNGWNLPREYQVPANILKPGKNVIAVRIIDYQGDGGIHGDKNDLFLQCDIINSKVSLAGPWKYKASYSQKLPQFQTLDTNFHANTPTALYNAMIHPLLNYRIAGAIWYQGESNKDRAIQYRSIFPAMIKDWRHKWDQGDFPFYFVQIAPYKYEYEGNSQLLREAQLMSMSVPNTGMAVTLDIGEYDDIHPKNKHDVGDRLARWALAKDYGKDVAYCGPIYREKKIEGNKIRLYFDYAENGLKAAEGGLKDFMIAGNGNSFAPAEAVIDGNTVVVYSPYVHNPEHVRYGWRDWVMGTLFNSEGLPASSFRTDNY